MIDLSGLVVDEDELGKTLDQLDKVMTAYEGATKTEIERLGGKLVSEMDLLSRIQTNAVASAAVASLSERDRQIITKLVFNKQINA